MPRMFVKIELCSDCGHLEHTTNGCAAVLMDAYGFRERCKCWMYRPGDVVRVMAEVPEVQPCR
jgi:hypothetical protein